MCKRPTMRSFALARSARLPSACPVAFGWLTVIILVSLTLLGMPARALGESIAPAPAQQSRGGVETGSQAAGTVELPREVYDRLIEAARNPTRLPKPAPASFALGHAEVSVDATTAPDGTVSAAVTVNLAIETLEDDWVLVPVLPAGTSVASAKVGGNAVQLVSAPAGLAWATRGRGKHQMRLEYRVDASGSEGGMSLALPMPAAASIRLTALLPGADLDASVIPAAGVALAQQGNRTQVRATIPSTQAVQLLWQTPLGDTHATSRARYTGTLEDDALTFEGSLDVEVFRDAAATLDLVPRSVTLRDVTVDGKPASILVRGDRFATLVRGRGAHTVKVVFQVPVEQGQGLPGVTVDIPAVPVSRFDLVLPGRKELVAEPATSVKSRFEDGQTRATVFAPMRSRVAFRWTEAVPEAVRTETRANASLYHAAWAEEGVLFVQALVRYEISRGEASVVQLTVPAGVQVDRIRDLQAGGDGQAVADWRTGPVEDGRRSVSIYLNRPLEGELVLAVDYDRPLPKDGPLTIPLVQAPVAQRARGMIALLQSRDLTLEPAPPTDATDAADAADGATRVGENQLPALVREQLTLPVAHTFKYVAPPRLSVVPSVPERQAGKFDAAVDTLISLGEVTLEASATVEIDVKSGGIESLRLVLPAGVTLLGLTGPSIRAHTVLPQTEGGGSETASQYVDVAFTQAMEGQFRLEARYERILQAEANGVAVPTLAIEGADVEQGRIAVEALSAVEVQAAGAAHLTALDPGELPRQLLLRTSNPILLAYKYVRAVPRPALELAVQRHQLLGVQEAVIDQADYRTLLTRDGMAVTTARFVVRNSRKQFLRLTLPEGARVWSAFVDGQSEKPALASATESPDEGRGGASDGASQVLLKIKNATDGFVVELIYEVPGPRLGGLGTVHATLPQPDILVTQTQWDVFLPADLRYGAPRTSMELTAEGVAVAADVLREEMALAQDGSGSSEPLLIAVPTAGVRYSFTKLYANQRDDIPALKIGYASRHGASFGNWLTVLATLLAWLGFWAAVRLRADRRGSEQSPPSWHAFRRMGLVLGVVGVAGVATLVGAFHLSVRPVLVTSFLVIACGAVAGVVRWWRERRDAALDF